MISLQTMASRVTNRQAAAAIIVLVVGVSVHKYSLGTFNNYRIFARSFDVLVSHQDLYAPHPDLHDDVFKYSPTFPLFMAPFAWQPDATGLVCWNLLNALLLVAAIRRLWPEGPQSTIAIAVIALELVVSLQSSQSNGIVAALMILAFTALERGRSSQAGFFIVAGFFLKIYGVAVAALALLYRERWRIAVHSAMWFVLFAAAPLVLLSVDELIDQYTTWLGVGQTFKVPTNASLMRLVDRYLYPGADPRVVQAIGGVIYALPFARIGAWHDPLFRLKLLCSLLIAVVIFNNSAEPPTYVIAVAGGAIWYAATPTRRTADHVFALTLLLVVSLISTDVYPREFRGLYAGPYTVKALGCLVIWLRINFELLTTGSGTGTRQESGSASR